MDRRWRSWTSPLAWLLTGACAVAAAGSGLVSQIGSGFGVTGLVPVPTGLSLAVLAAAALHSVANAEARDRAPLGIIAAVALVAALVIDVNNAIESVRAQDAFGPWAALATAIVHVVAAVGTLMVTLVWFRGAQVNDPAPQIAALPPERQPSWSADQAVGASWTRAGDAATGAPAVSAASSGWGLPRAPEPEAHPPEAHAPQDHPEVGIARPVPGVPTAADWAAGQPQGDSSETNSTPPGVPDEGEQTSS